MKRGMITVNGLRLSYLEAGDQAKPSVLLLHGLFGRGATWAETAGWLAEQFHVVALDQRGHGRSDKPDNAYSREAFIADAAAVIEALQLGPAIVIGHSMGGLTGWQLAARHPDLVRALVIEDMTAANKGDKGWVRKWLDSWPVPFPTIESVRAYFGAQRPSWAGYFAECFYEAEDGYRPLARTEHMVQAAEAMKADFWVDLEQVRCPALVVKGEVSDCPREMLQEMGRRLSEGRYAEVAGASHTVHNDEPEGFRAVLEPFLLGRGRE